MEISTRAIILFVVTGLLYVYLVDTFKKSTFQTKVKYILNNTIGNSTSNTILNLIDNTTNTMAAVVSVSSMSLLSSIPVSIFHQCFNVAIMFSQTVF